MLQPIAGHASIAAATMPQAAASDRVGVNVPRVADPSDWGLSLRRHDKMSLTAIFDTLSGRPNADTWIFRYQGEVEKARQAVSDAVGMGDPALIGQRTKALEYLLRYCCRSYCGVSTAPAAWRY
jgi:hypothetical protein